jgi:hypothetical protein
MTTIPISTTSPTKEELRALFLPLLVGLDTILHSSYWNVLGSSDDGLYNCLGFNTFDQYKAFMIDIGFIGKSFRKTGKQYFISKEFEKWRQRQFSITRVGRSKCWYLQLGKQESTIQDEKVQEINLKWPPIVEFLESQIVRTWARSCEQECTTNASPAARPRRIGSTPGAEIRKRPKAKELVSPNLRPKSKQRFKSPSPRVAISTSHSDNQKTPTPSKQAKRQLFMQGTPAKLVPKSNLFATTRLTPAKHLPNVPPRPTPTNLAPKSNLFPTARLAPTNHFSNVPPQPNYMRTTKASVARGHSPDTVLLELASQHPDISIAIRRVATKICNGPHVPHYLTPTKATRAKRITADSSLSTIALRQEPGNEPPRRVETPRIYHISGPTKNIPEGFEYKCTKAEDKTTLHFLVSKGWDAETYYQKKKDKSRTETVFVVPTRRETIDSTQKSKVEERLEISESKLAKLDKKMDTSSSRFDWNMLSRRILGALIAFHPKISSLAWEQVPVFILAAFIIEIGGPLDFEQLYNISPSRQTAENLVFDFAIDSAMVFSDSINHSKIYYASHDKADSSKGKNGGCVKLLAGFDDRLTSEEHPDGQVVVGTVDADKSGDTSADVAQNVSHSVRKLELDENAKCHGITSDSGGGGNTESGAREFEKLGELNFAPSMLVANCTMHNLNLELAVAMKKIMIVKDSEPEGNKTNGKKKKRPDEVDRNVEQLLYTAFAWEKEVGVNVIREYWDASKEYCYEKDFNAPTNDDDGGGDDEEGKTNGKDHEEVLAMFGNLEKGDRFVVMIRGAETRWWTLGEAADVLYKTLPMRRFMATNFDDTKSAKTAKSDGKATKIAQDFLSLSAEPVLLCDLALLKCFHRFYLARHLKFYQTADGYTKKAGFQAFSVLNQCFLQDLDYNRMKTNWRDIPEFKDLCDRLEAIPTDETRNDGRSLHEFQELKIAAFFDTAHAEHKKMFARWLDINKLAFLAAFAEPETGNIVCRRLLGLPMFEFEGDSQREFFSKNHGRNFHLGQYAYFIASIIPEDFSLFSNYYHNRVNKDLFEEIRHGLNLWDGQDPSTKQHRLRVLRRYAALFTSNQGTERANKDQNLACYNQRKEVNSSVRMIGMACIKEMTVTTVFGQKRREFRGKKRIVEMKDRIMEVDRAIRSIESRLGTTEFKAKRKRIGENLKKTFSAVRVQQMKQYFEDAFEVQHVESAKERRKGFDVAPILDGKLQFGKLFEKNDGQQTNNVQLLKTELTKRLEADRGCERTPAEKEEMKKKGIKAVKDGIQKHEERRYARRDEAANSEGTECNENEESNENAPVDNDGFYKTTDRYDKRFFKVLYTPIDQYFYKLV